MGLVHPCCMAHPGAYQRLSVYSPGYMGTWSLSHSSLHLLRYQEGLKKVQVLQEFKEEEEEKLSECPAEYEEEEEKEEFTKLKSR